MKLIVKAKGKFMLLTPQGEEVQHYRPSVVSKSEFISQRVANGQLEVLATDLPDDAKDSDFEKFYLDSGKDVQLALGSYLTKVKPDEATEGDADNGDPGDEAKAGRQGRKR